MVERTIVNKAAQTIVLREEVEIAEGVGSSEIAKVIKGEKGMWRVDPKLIIADILSAAAVATYRLTARGVGAESPVVAPFFL